MSCRLQPEIDCSLFHWQYMANKVFCLLLVWSFSPAALAHGGGLNAEGCHNNRKTGDYHCHRAQASADRNSQIPAPPTKFIDGQTHNDRRVESSNRREAGASEVARPTCYTGPRGGTYTITPSGRKNYSGC